MVFAPTVDGGHSATLVLVGDRGATIASVALVGEAKAPGQQQADLSVDIPFITFGEQRLRIPSGPQSVLVRNNANQDIRLRPVTVTGAEKGDFSLKDPCGGKVLTSHELCRLDVIFTPGGVEGRSATLAVSGEDSAEPWTVSLSGTGTAPAVEISGGTLEFAAEQIGTPSVQRVVTLTNSGTAPASISVNRPAGSNPDDFVVDDECPKNLPPGTSCVVKVSFRPAAAGARRARLTIIHDAPGSPAVVELTGRGTLPPPPPRVDLSVQWERLTQFDSNIWPWGETVVVRNIGPTVATGVRLDVDGRVALRWAGSATCRQGTSSSAGSAPLTCTLGSLAPGDTAVPRPLPLTPPCRGNGPGCRA